MDKKQKGAIGEQQVLLDLLKRGYKVLLPFNEDCPYDLVVDNCDGTFTKVQCKYREDAVVPSRRSHADGNGSHVKYYTKEEVDVFAMVLGLDNPSVYYVPFNLRGITLKENANKSWAYLQEDFVEYPCKDVYEKKTMLSNGRVVSDKEKETLISIHDRSLTMRENSEKHNIPLETYKNWIRKSESYKRLTQEEMRELLLKNAKKLVEFDDEDKPTGEVKE